jgi:aminoglycoside phosphotransferase (APT) family kinase protein
MIAKSDDSFGRTLAAGAPQMVDTQGALDPIELARQLSLLPTSQFPWGKVEKVHSKPVATPRQDHQVFDILISSVGGGERLNGKAYLKDRQDVYEAMENIRRAGFGSGEEFSIPRPVAYLRSLRLLLQEWVDGTQAKKIFKLGDEGQRVAAAEACARWLARFHALAPPAGPVSGVKTYLDGAERKCRIISEADEQWVGRCEELLERLRAAAPSPSDIHMSASHGDYCELQVILAAGRTAVVDWDDYDVADPTRDVAHFIVCLERLGGMHLGSNRALEGSAEVFLKTYLASGGHAQVAAHLPFYKAVLWLKPRDHIIRTKSPGWRESAEVMLDEACRALGQEVEATVEIRRWRGRKEFLKNDDWHA